MMETANPLSLEPLSKTGNPLTYFDNWKAMASKRRLPNKNNVRVGLASSRQLMLLYNTLYSHEMPLRFAELTDHHI